jgi:hypothetical protein
MAVNVDWDVVEGVEDLDKIFKKALARAEDADEPAIRQEWAESKATFYERRAQAAELRSAKRDALDKYPLAKEWADDIKGGTAAEIEAQAKRFHERMEKVTADAVAAKEQTQQTRQDIQQQAQQQYGQPAAGGGGAIAHPNSELTVAQAATQRVRDRLSKGEGLQRSGDKMDVNLMAAHRLREAVEFQREAHPELGLGIGGSFKQEPQGNPIGTRVVDARSEARKAAQRK